MKKQILIIVILVTICSNCFSQTFTISEKYKLVMQFPEAWKLVELQVPMDIPIKDIELNGPEKVKIKATFILDKNGGLVNPSKDLIEKMAYISSQRYIAMSEEADVNLKYVEKTNLYGTYAQFCNKHFNPQTATSKDHKCVTNGVFNIDGLIMAVSIYSTGLDVKSYSEALSILETFNLKK